MRLGPARKVDLKNEKKDDDPRPEGTQAPPKEDEQRDHLAQPVDADLPPHLPFTVVGMGASAGGLEAFQDFFEGMPADSGMAFVLVQHLPPDRKSMVAEILAKHTSMPVHQIHDGMPVEPNQVYVIRPGHTLTLRGGILHLGAQVERPRHGRPVDDFFKSLAEEQRQRAICVILSGMGSNGSAGARAIKAVGGLCIAQDPDSAQFPSMPRHLIDIGCADFVLRPRDIPDALVRFANHPYSVGRQNAVVALGRDEQQLRDILSILRNRTHQDFNGYKKHTLLRRVHRRMSLSRVTQIDDYAKILRQSQGEVSALADDLLIHVTGFFRDAPAWEALNQRVIKPLVESREDGGSVRCWVTACASGEEAYSLAMLLVEECERQHKSLDVKIFATDSAVRTLSNARNGIFPGGIESEIAPERLERFFQREDAVYRVRQDLRERVVFAPQNVLRDPPFSRLDIVTCRNLLIYLEPDVQQRLISFLHFGLREGGALFLGTSETISGPEGLFETLDKKARIYRRIGPSRRGAIEFPAPSSPVVAPLELPLPAEFASPSVAKQTIRALLARHVPCAVTVDRKSRVVYFHGATAPYLIQPTGEPTRELLALVCEPLRGTVRSALRRSMSTRSAESVSDRWIEVEGIRRRIVVTVSPIDGSPAPDLFVISFQQSEEPAPQPAEAQESHTETEQELRRVRDELRATVEELQASSEEQQAASEEVMSINEELQSSNEELETSKEEMQSLNEELTTLNAQLQAKMEEHQIANDDLSALLSSTDIAVIFLDTHFRIRRFTPAARSVVQMIPSDIGRPLNDLASKIADPNLIQQARLVLERLTPIEDEILRDDGSWYQRRILPYRTTDNRIEGVVLVFMEITERKRAEEVLRMSEGQLSAELRVVTRLNDVTSKVLAATGPSSALPEILNSALELMEADKGDILLVDEDAGDVRRVASVGFDPKAEHPVSTAPDTPWMQALHGRQRVIVQSSMGSTTRGDRAPNDVPPEVSVVLCTPLQTRRNQGLGVLSVYFHQARAPSERQLRLFDQFARLASDLIERVRGEELLTRLLRAEQSTRRALDEAAHVKDEFLATLSHELRTPLNVILLWARVLRDAPDDIADKSSAVDAIVRSAEVQHRLIEDLLDNSRIAAGKLRLDPRETELAPIVHSAVDAILPTSRSKGVRIEQEIGHIGDVVADPERLHQVLWNLLNNAVKFTPSGGLVRVEVEQVERQVEIRVRDTGMGIAPEFLSLMFDRFRQAEQARTNPGGGLGLGLSISRQLVELHGGKIWAESDGLDKGSTVFVRLPATQPRASPQASGAEAASVRDGPQLDRVRVLLVEDQPQTQEVVRFVLSQAGADVSSCANASEALSAYELSRPDVIVSDIGLPDFDGYELLRRIRALEDAQKVQPIPAIALTAFAFNRDRRESNDAGYQLHLAKPVEGPKLIGAIRKLVRV
jgi:two-component system CheB/CheR fusion protein